LKDGADSVFDHKEISKNPFVASQKFSKLKTIEHKTKTTVKELEDKLNMLGLYIPADYVFCGKDEMMAKRTGPSINDNKEWCEGEVFKFAREIDGNRIISDNCIAAIRNDDIIMYRLTYHPIEKSGKRQIKKLVIDSNVADKDLKKIEPKLVYDYKEGQLIPTWEIEYENFIFRYDATNGETYYRK
jgi:hypothetical protein